MNGGNRFAEPVGLAGEIAADLVGVQVAFREQVTNAGRGHRPAFGGVGLKLSDHPQRPSATAAFRRGYLIRAEQSSDVRVAGPAQRPAQLDVGVDAAVDPTKHLEDRAPIEDHAGVGLLSVGYVRRRIQRQRDSGSLANMISVPEDSRTAAESINDSRYCGASTSYSASKPVRSSAAPMVATVLYSETGAESHSTRT